MRHTFTLFLVFAFSLLIWSCGDSGDKTNTEPSGNTGEETAEAEVDGPVEMRVWVDDLRIRKASGADAEVIGEFAEGTVVEFRQEQSEEEHTAELRGKKISAPWMKVYGPDGKYGWVFGGGLEDASKAPTGEGTGVSAYKSYLKGLPKGDCASVSQAANKLKKDLKGAEDEAREAGIRAFAAYYYEVLSQAENKAYGSLEADLETFDWESGKYKSKKATDQVAKWKTCGVGMWFPEGIPTPTEDPGYLNGQFKDFGSKPMIEFLERHEKDLKEGFSADAGLMITPMQLAERLTFWDNFQERYPDFEGLQGGKIDYTWERSVMMTGLDNTPAFDWGSEGEDANKLYPDWKEAYEWILKNHRNTRTGKLIKDYYDLLKKHDFRRTKEVTAFSQEWFESHSM